MKKLGVAFTAAAASAVLAILLISNPHETDSGILKPKECSEGMISYWKMDKITSNKTVVDECGRNTGTVKGDVKVTPDGVENKSLYFDGAADYIEFADNDDLDLTGDFTIAAWVKPEATKDNQYIIQKGKPGMPGATGYILAWAGDNHPFGWIQSSFSGQTLPGYIIDYWHYMVLTKNGNEGNLYLDGVLSAKFPSMNATNTALSMYMGGGNTPNAFKGHLDEVRIFSKAISSSEVGADFLTQFENGFCGNWKKEPGENQNNCLIDSLVLGCKNSPNAKCIDFAPGSDLQGEIKIAPPSNLTDGSTENGTSYRTLKTSKAITINFPKFNDTNNDGLPDTSMVLEIRYKDIIPPQYSTVNNNKGRLRSIIDLTGWKFEPVFLGGLGGKNDHLWKTEHILLKKTPFQLTRLSKDNTYKFNLGIYYGNTIPIDYIALHALSDQLYKSFEDFQKAEYNLKYLNRESTGSIPEKPAMFTRSTTEPVYETTYPGATEEVCVVGSACSPVSKRAAKGETFTLSFSIASQQNLDNVTIDLNSLPPGLNDVKTFQVVNDFKNWVVSGYGMTYGLMPDRIEPFSSTSIDANKTKTFWLVFKLPENIKSQKYNLSIKILSGSNILFDVPAEVEVMPFTLEKPTNNITLYIPYPELPHQNDYSFIYGNLADHNISPILPRAVGRQASAHFNVDISTNGPEECANIAYNFNRFKTELDEVINSGLLTKEHFIQIQLHDDILFALFSGSSGNLTLYEKLDSLQFKKAYTCFIKGLNKIAEENPADFVFVYEPVDEPCTGHVGRITVDRIYPIIKQTGGKTWASYHPEPCSKPVSNLAHAPPGTVIPPFDDPDNPVIDYKIYAINTVNDAEISANSDRFGYYTTNYSNLRNPVYNRFMGGYYAHVTGAKAVNVYAYGGATHYINDPFNDFDTGWNRVYPYQEFDYLLAYPSWNGNMISTMSFEGLREGITDLSYLSTLKTAIDKCPAYPAAIKADNKFYNNASSSYRFKGLPLTFFYNSYDDVTDCTQGYLSKNIFSNPGFGFDNNILKCLSDSENNYNIFDDIRSEVSGYILKLTPPTYDIEEIKSIILELRDSAFDKLPATRKNDLITNLDLVIRNISACAASMAATNLKVKVQNRMDGCSGGNSFDDWIKDCDSQATLSELLNPAISRLEAMLQP